MRSFIGIMVALVVVGANAARADDDWWGHDQGPTSYNDQPHLRLGLGVGASSLGMRGALGLEVAWSMLVAGVELGGSAELFGGGASDVTGLVGVGFDLGSVARVELLGELGVRTVHVDESGLFGSGPRYDYDSPHAGGRLAFDIRLFSDNHRTHLRAGFVFFLRADLDGPSPFTDSYEDCGWALFSDEPSCTTETYTRDRGGGVEGGVMFRLALDVPI